MAASTLTIALPEPFKSYVEAHVKDGSFNSADDYVMHLILDGEELLDEEAIADEAFSDANLQDSPALQAMLTKALQGKRYPISREELAQGNLIDLLRRKLAPVE